MHSEARRTASHLAFDQLLGASAEPGQSVLVPAHLETSSLRPAHSTLQQVQAFSRACPPGSDARQRTISARGALAVGRRAAVAASPFGALARARRAAPGLRSKGRPALGAYVNAATGCTRRQRQHREASDYLRSPRATARAFACSTRRAAGDHYFSARAQTTQVAAGRDVALDFSIKLDGQRAASRSRSVLPAPEQLEPLRAALQATGQLRPCRTPRRRAHVEKNVE